MKLGGENKLKWFRIPKENSVQPKAGKYSDWKEIIADECKHQCIYCTLSESRFGGIRNFHVEHYRPKSKTKFAHLINDIKNLFLACSICNTFKGNDWPAEPKRDLSNISYPDPSMIDYSELFTYIDPCGEIKGKYIASKYLVEKLFLNRPQLILERRYFNLIFCFENYQNYCDKMETILEKFNTSIQLKYLKEYIKLFNELSKIITQLDKLPPYSIRDITKRKN